MSEWELSSVEQKISKLKSELSSLYNKRRRLLLAMRGSQETLYLESTRSKVPSPSGPKLKKRSGRSRPPGFSRLGITHENQAQALAKMSDRDILCTPGLGRKALRWLREFY